MVICESYMFKFSVSKDMKSMLHMNGGGKVSRPKTNRFLKPTLCTTCMHLQLPNACMWYIVLVLGSYRSQGGLPYQGRQLHMLDFSSTQFFYFDINTISKQCMGGAEFFPVARIVCQSQTIKHLHVYQIIIVR